MNKLFIIVFLLFLIPITYAYDICGDGPEINTKCAMLTPDSPQCPNGYSYTIYDVNNTVIESNPLSVWTNNIYYFNFTQPEGKYYIRLCDGATREVFALNPPEIKFYLYLLAIFIFISLIIFGYFSGDTVFYVIGGFLSAAIALNLYTSGFPNLENEMLQTVLIVIHAGIGFFFMIAPFINEFENWNKRKEDDDEW